MGRGRPPAVLCARTGALIRSASRTRLRGQHGVLGNSFFRREVNGSRPLYSANAESAYDAGRDHQNVILPPLSRYFTMAFLSESRFYPLGASPAVTLSDPLNAIDKALGTSATAHFDQQNPTGG